MSQPEEREQVPAHARWVFTCPRCEAEVLTEFAPPDDDECDACGFEVRTEPR